MAVLLQLSLCLVSLIQMTSCQSTYDVIREESDVTSCGRNEQALNQLIALNAQLMSAVSQLQRDVDELKTDRRQKSARGIRWWLAYCPEINYLTIAAAFYILENKKTSATSTRTVCAASVAAPSAWNRLPSHIRTSSTYTLFLTRLKTHLFAESLLWHCYAVVFSLYSGAPELWTWGAIASSCWLIDWSM